MENRKGFFPQSLYSPSVGEFSYAVDFIMFYNIKSEI